MLGVHGVRLLGMLRGISAVFLLTQLCSFCDCARRPRPSRAVQSPWQKFDAGLSGVAATSISGSQHMLTNLQPLAEKVAVDVQAAADSVTGLHRKFRVKCTVLIWEAGELPAGVVQGPSSVMKLGVGSIEISNGMISTIDCQKYPEHMPPPNTIGSMGWPCFRGGGTAVTATIKHSRRVLDGMVFYRPQSVRDYSELDITQRRPRYKDAVEYCLKQERAKNVINVSRFAVCIRENYPDVQHYSRHFARLRANVAFTNFKRNGADREAAVSSSDGGFWIDCTPHEPEKGSKVAPVSLCHAALFSILERASHDSIG